MSKERKEAIDLLVKAKKYLHYKSTESDYIDQALTKLREAPEQPPAGEFTKDFRISIDVVNVAERELAHYQIHEGLPTPEISQPWKDLILKGVEACDIIDKLQAQEQPLAGDFTKAMREKYKYAIKAKLSVYAGAYVEALNRLDRVEASKADLLTAIKQIQTLNAGKDCDIKWLCEKTIAEAKKGKRE